MTIPSNPADAVNGATFTLHRRRLQRVLRNTLYELLTQYGPIDEVWWDGANPLAGAGRDQPYDFDDWTRIVRTLHPNAVIFNDGGPDVRCVAMSTGPGS